MYIGGTREHEQSIISFADGDTTIGLFFTEPQVGESICQIAHVRRKIN